MRYLSVSRYAAGHLLFPVTFSKELFRIRTLVLGAEIGHKFTPGHLTSS